MRKTFLIFGLVLGFVLSWSMVCSAQKVVVIPLLGDEPARNAALAPVEKTGQTECYKSASPWGTCTCGDAHCPSGQDGDLEKGVAWPTPRFTDKGNGTVKDNLTGLIWLKNANCFGLRNWATALSDCNGLATGSCGLTDGSSAGDWRLANIKELQSLIDFGNSSGALPSDHPFTDVQGSYWSSTTHAGEPVLAWYVGLEEAGYTGLDSKDVGVYYVWPVRGGQ